MLFVFLCAVAMLCICVWKKHTNVYHVWQMCQRSNLCLIKWVNLLLWAADKRWKNPQLLRSESKCITGVLNYETWAIHTPERTQMPCFNLTHVCTLVKFFPMIKDSWCGWSGTWGAEIKWKVAWTAADAWGWTCSSIACLIFCLGQI